MYVGWYGVNDISARPNDGAAGLATSNTPIPNDLGDLSNRENRYARQRCGRDFFDAVNGNGAGARRDHRRPQRRPDPRLLPDAHVDPGGRRHLGGVRGHHVCAGRLAHHERRHAAADQRDGGDSLHRPGKRLGERPLRLPVHLPRDVLEARVGLARQRRQRRDRLAARARHEDRSTASPATRAASSTTPRSRSATACRCRRPAAPTSSSPGSASRRSARPRRSSGSTRCISPTSAGGGAAARRASRSTACSRSPRARCRRARTTPTSCRRSARCRPWARPARRPRRSARTGRATRSSSTARPTPVTRSSR